MIADRMSMSTAREESIGSRMLIDFFMKYGFIIINKDGTYSMALPCGALLGCFPPLARLQPCFSFNALLLVIEPRRWRPHLRTSRYNTARQGPILLSRPITRPRHI